MRLKCRAVCAFVACGVLALAGCSTGSSSTTPADPSISRVLDVVAAENFWGSIAADLGGKQVRVTNIINSPNADPHDYEATAADGRALASANLVLVNGLGYDTWASKLTAANPNPARTLLDVGNLLALPADANPHRWYNPADVARVVDQLTADYKELDPADAAYFDQQNVAFQTTALAAYRSVIADIRTRYAGTAVGASESIFAMLAPALELDLITPPSFLTAISQGADATAADKKRIDEQISSRAMKVYLYNAQNATPDIQAQVTAAEAEGIPVSAITETLPAGAQSWQQWQTTQLVALRDALAKATGT